MDMRKPSWILVTLSLIVLMGGCFKAEQEYWIHSDGSGKVHTRFGISKQMISMARRSGSRGAGSLERFKCSSSAVNRIKDHELTHNVKCSVKDEGDMRVLDVRYNVYDMRKLQSLAEQGQANQRYELRIEENGRGQLTFNQSLSIPSERTSQLSNPRARRVIKSLISGRYWKVTLHAPEIVSTNGKLGKDKRTVEWKVPVSKLIFENGYRARMQATVSMGYGWLFWVATIGGGILIVLIFAGVLIFILA